jgi:hypothetical protein
VVHPGTRLSSKLDEPGVLWCCLSGTFYKIDETAIDEYFDPGYGPIIKRGYF